MAREARVNVMIEPYVRERLEFYSKGMGMTLSSLCSYVLANYVFQQDVILEKLGQALSPETVAELLDKQIEVAKKTVEDMGREDSARA